MVKATNAAGQTEYCRISGNIRPVDPAAPMIKVQVGMPNIWNSKAMMFGGGKNGKIPSPESNVYAAPLRSVTPLDRGYATFGSDSGRTPIHKIIVATADIKNAIRHNANAAELKNIALREGMRTLRMDGVLEIMQGLTDLEQRRHGSFSYLVIL
jgi:hypothetical protein